MTGNHENRITMWRVVLATLASYASTWNALAPMAAAVASLQSKYDEVTAQRNIQAQGTKGITIQKKKLREKAMTLMLPVLSAIRTYGKQNDVYALTTYNAVTPSYLDSLRDTTIVMELERILSSANQYSTQLATYGITSTQLTDCQDAITALSDVVALPRLLLTQKVAATKAIDNIVEAGQALLKDMDDMVTILSAPQFESEYKKARKIIHLGHRYTSAIVTIMPMLDEDADIVITNDNGTYTGKKNTDGAYEFPSMRPGKYQCHIMGTQVEYTPINVTIERSKQNILQLDFKTA